MASAPGLLSRDRMHYFISYQTTTHDPGTSGLCEDMYLTYGMATTKEASQVCFSPLFPKHGEGERRRDGNNIVLPHLRGPS